MPYRDADHYAPPDEPEPGAADLAQADAEAFERGAEDYKAQLDAKDEVRNCLNGLLQYLQAEVSIGVGAAARGIPPIHNALRALERLS